MVISTHTKRLALSLALILGLTAIILGVSWRGRWSGNARAISHAPPVPSVAVMQPILPAIELAQMESPEGSKTLLLGKVSYKQNTLWNLEVAQNNTDTTPVHTWIPVYASPEAHLTSFISPRTAIATPSATLVSAQGVSALEIPFNTWSPDTTYFYLTEKRGNHIDYVVFRADAASINQTEQQLRIAPLFQAAHPDYIMDEVTGWASPTLLIINAHQVKTGTLASFWFEVPTGAIIPLSTYFR